MLLTEVDRSELLRLARAVLLRLPENPARPSDFQAEVRIPSAALQAKRAFFVSLHERKNGKLRGCIGTLTPSEPLCEAIVEGTVASATRDTRFDPVQPQEVDDLSIEISVLGPMEEVRDTREIEIGRHGLVVEQEKARGLLLPQVATQFSWSVEEFLENTCRKAGLQADAWKQNAIIKRFEAEVFAERLDS